MSFNRILGENTTERRRTMSQEDYERGQRDGNEPRFARPSRIVDYLGGDDYVKGLDATYKQRCDKAGLFGTTDNRPPSSKGSSSSTSDTTSSDSDSGSYGGGGGGRSSGGSYNGGGGSTSGNWGCLKAFFIILFALWLLGLIITGFQKQQLRQVQRQAINNQHLSVTEQAPQLQKPVVKKKTTPQPQPRPAEQIKMKKVIHVSAPYLPPGTQITAWTIENGVKTRALDIVSVNQDNGTLKVTLAEAIPASEKVRVNWVVPRQAIQPNFQPIQAPQYVYQSQQHAPRQFTQHRRVNNYRGNQQHRGNTRHRSNQQQWGNRQQRHR